MKTLILALSFLFLSVVSAAAQAPPPANLDYEIQVLISATATTVLKGISHTIVLCGLVPSSAPVPLVNPTNVEWADDANTTPGNPKVCRASVGNFFSTLPAASGYVATITAIDTSVVPNLVSDRSAVSNPFDAARVRPAARTGLGARP